MFNHDAGHSHGPTPHLVTGCPLCDVEKAARDQAIGNLSEALRILANIRPHDARPTLRLNLGPIGVTGDDTHLCRSVDLTAKQGEALSDAIDSLSAHAGSESPVDGALQDLADAISDAVVARPGGFLGEAIVSGEWSAAAVAQNDPQLYADVTDLFLLVDPQSYLDDVVNADCPEAAQAAFEQLVTGEWDGEL